MAAVIDPMSTTEVLNLGTYDPSRSVALRVWARFIYLIGVSRNDAVNSTPSTTALDGRRDLSCFHIMPPEIRAIQA